MEVISCFSEIREKDFFKISWLDCEQYGKNQYLNATNPLITPMIFIFFSCYEKAHNNKNSVVKIQNLIVNHESGPIKSNSIYRNVN